MQCWVPGLHSFPELCWWWWYFESPFLYHLLHHYIWSHHRWSIYPCPLTLDSGMWLALVKGMGPEVAMYQFWAQVLRDLEHFSMCHLVPLLLPWEHAWDSPLVPEGGWNNGAELPLPWRPEEEPCHVSPRPTLRSTAGQLSPAKISQPLTKPQAQQPAQHRATQPPSQGQARSTHPGRQ